MDSSLQSANLTTGELTKSLANKEGILENVGGHDEEEHHIHLPNPSLWPLLLGAAMLIAVTGILFFPSNPWLTVVGAPLVIIGILGWALEDPMAPKTDNLADFYHRKEVPSRFQLGEQAVDKDGYILGKVEARFTNYILVERSGLLVKTYYVPQHLATNDTRRGIVRLALSEDELIHSGYNAVPDDLYDETPEYGAPVTSGVAQYARGPLSPAETGHYNYGPNFPGMNTDASGSYHHEEVRPTPQRYVGDRRRLYANDKTLPRRATKAD
ncbi:MAG: hypothetical protein NVS4B12_27380 [Ktedonobacteraceae bacterium]